MRARSTPNLTNYCEIVVNVRGVTFFYIAFQVVRRNLKGTKMKDKQGITRGKCIVVDCECTEYVKSQDSGGVRCDYCDHVPVKHVKMIKLGACTNCKECPSYESEDSGSYSDCAYCDCPAQFHKDADKRNEII